MTNYDSADYELTQEAFNASRNVWHEYFCANMSPKMKDIVFQKYGHDFMRRVLETIAVASDVLKEEQPK